MLVAAFCYEVVDCQCVPVHVCSCVTVLSPTVSCVVRGMSHVNGTKSFVIQQENGRGSVCSAREGVFAIIGKGGAGVCCFYVYPHHFLINLIVSVVVILYYNNNNIIW